MASERPPVVGAEETVDEVEVGVRGVPEVRLGVVLSVAPNALAKVRGSAMLSLAEVSMTRHESGPGRRAGLVQGPLLCRDRRDDTPSAA